MTPPFPFLVGCPRSGTSLVRVMFASHPDVALVPDSRFVADLLPVFRRPTEPAPFDAARFVDAIYANEAFRRWQLPRSAVELSFHGDPPTSYAVAARRIYQLWTRRQGKARYLDATMGNIDRVAALTMLFPESRVVHVVRDGRDVAASLLENGWVDRMEDAASYWRETVGSARRTLAHLPAGRCYELRYEDLVRSPEPVLRAACDAIELPFDPAMLEYRRNATAVVRASSQPHRHHFLVHPLMRGLRDWRRDLPSAAVDRFEAVAADVLDELGYELGSETGRRARFAARHRARGWQRRVTVP